MFDARTFHDLVSGRRRGVGAAISRAALAAAESPYTLAVTWRNRRYDRGLAAIHRVGVPVLSIGNLTLGGTGKTPLVGWLARRVHESGRPVAIVSRGYGAAAGNRNDEALELDLTVPEIPHVQNPDRIAAVGAAVEQHGAEAIILDDGFQHRRLARDLDIVLLDALEPFGYGHVFPRGLLREPVRGLARAEVIVVSRADLVSADARSVIRRQVERIRPGSVWCEVAHAPQSLINASGRLEPISMLADLPAAAFCGIGNPAGFQRTLETCGFDVAAWREFPDHYAYSSRDIALLTAWARATCCKAVLCTQKDLVKLRRDELGGIPLWAVGIEIEFLTGCETFLAAVDRTLG